MKKPSQRIKPVIQVAESREQQAAKALGLALKKLEAQQQRLAELRAHEESYAQRFQQTGAQGISALDMQRFQLFLQNLSTAIREQQLVVAGAERELESKRQQWLTRRGKVEALDKVAARYVEQELRREEQQDQRENDAHAAQTSRRDTSR